MLTGQFVGNKGPPVVIYLFSKSRYMMTTAVALTDVKPTISFRTFFFQRNFLKLQPALCPMLPRLPKNSAAGFLFAIFSRQLHWPLDLLKPRLTCTKRKWKQRIG